MAINVNNMALYSWVSLKISFIFASIHNEVTIIILFKHVFKRQCFTLPWQLSCLEHYPDAPTLWFDSQSGDPGLLLAWEPEPPVSDQ